MSEPTRPPRRPDASMTLLTSMLERPLDPGYQEAADRRRARGLPSSAPTRSVVVVVMAVLTGFLFAVSASALRPRPTAAASVKEQLVSRIETLQQQGSAQEAKLAALGTQVREYEAAELTQSGGSALSARIGALEVQAAAVALDGPGVTLTLDDATTADTDAAAGTRPSGGFAPGRVSSSDLQIAVNGLWAAGAEAVSINGHRLSATAAIRFAGQAVIVDFRPLTRPYVVTALGDADTLKARFEASFSGAYLTQLGDQYGIASDLATSDALSVPADTAVRLVHAEPLGLDPTPSASPSTSPSASPSTARSWATPDPSTSGGER